MAELPVIADVFRVTMGWSAGSTPMANVLHFYAPTLNETDVKDVFLPVLDPDMVAAMSSGCHLTSLAVLPLDGSTPTETTELDGTFTGLGNDQWIPQQAAVVSIKTATRGRSHRGRIFLPAVAESSQLAGQIDVGAIDLMQAAWETALDSWAAGGILLGVASYKLETFEPATTVVCKIRSGTQRRRNH